MAGLTTTPAVASRTSLVTVPPTKGCQPTSDTDIAVIDRLPDGTVYYQLLGGYAGGGCTPSRTYLSTVAAGERSCMQAALAKDNPTFVERIDGPRQTLKKVQWTAGTC